MSQIHISKLRQEISRLIQKRLRQEKIAFGKSPMVQASFYQKKSNGTCYLSASRNGQTRHRYVPKNQRAYWKKRAEEWKSFSQAMMKWVKINQQIEAKFREMGQLRCELLPGGQRDVRQRTP